MLNARKIRELQLEDEEAAEVAQAASEAQMYGSEQRQNSNANVNKLPARNLNDSVEGMVNA